MQRAAAQLRRPQPQPIAPPLHDTRTPYRQNASWTRWILLQPRSLQPIFLTLTWTCLKNLSTTIFSYLTSEISSKSKTITFSLQLLLGQDSSSPPCEGRARLAIALRYLAGGQVIDLSLIYHVSKVSSEWVDGSGCVSSTLCPPAHRAPAHRTLVPHRAPHIVIMLRYIYIHTYVQIDNTGELRRGLTRPRLLWSPSLCSIKTDGSELRPRPTQLDQGRYGASPRAQS